MSNLYIDLDGVILNSEEKILQLKEKSNNLSWNNFFAELDWYKLLSESKEINNSVEILKILENSNLKYSILTKIHTLLEMEAKVKNIRERGLEAPIIFVPPHIKKSEIIIPKSGDELIDDSIKNIVHWNDDGGLGVLFDQYDNKETPLQKVRSLEFLLKRR